MLGEWIADRQLAAFRANPKNKGGVCKDRLWRYSRHPNYFFEWLHWFAYLAFAMGFIVGGFRPDRSHCHVHFPSFFDGRALC
jgi:steroid 5-alpha reductase family enzyme